MASDTFTRANETPIAAPWTKNGGNNVNLASNAITLSAAGDTYYYYTGAASGADQFSQASEVTTVTDHDWGPAVRVGGAGHTTVAEGYAVDLFQWGAGSGIIKHVNGSFSQVSTFSGAGTALNDVLRIEAAGTTLKAFRNGTQLGSNATDTSLTGGQPGIFIFANGGTIDNWSGGDLGATPITASDSQTQSEATTALANALATSEAHAVTDSSASSLLLSRTDSFTFSDASALVITLALAAVDAVALTDVSALAVALATTESGALTEGASSLANALATTDALTLSELSAIAAVLSTTESGALSDSSALATALSVVDTLTLSEASAIAAALSAFDSNTLSELASIGGNQFLTGSETFTLTESSALLATVGLSVTDSSTLAEASAVLASLGISDSLVVTDSSALTTQQFKVAVDAGLLTESSFLLTGGVTPIVILPTTANILVWAASAAIASTLNVVDIESGDMTADVANDLKGVEILNGG